MHVSKIFSVLKMYERRLIEEGVSRKRMDTTRTFESLSKAELLAHAYYLIDGTKEFASQKSKEGKTGRHLAAIQMCLSFAGWYTLEDLMNHNKPD